MKKVKTGIIGCGAIAPSYLMHLTRTFSSLVEVVACADLVPERAQSRAEEFGVPRACSTAELIADPEIELVVNLTIPDAHFETSLAAFEAGKHVFCEKPLCPTREAARRL